MNDSISVITSIGQMRSRAEYIKKSGTVLGFIPTMGALHDGHISLIKEMKKVAPKSHIVLSVFVNEKQFSSGEDFDIYPRDNISDIQKCRDNDVDTVFIPKQEEMYGNDFSCSISTGKISEPLCGKSRPNYFNGVALVLTKLFLQICPNIIAMGEKDYQMCLVTAKLIKNFDFPIKLLKCKCVRESDGLAMSSRNLYLSSEERKKAPMLYNSMKKAAAEILECPIQARVILEQTKINLIQNGFDIDYLEIRDDNMDQPTYIFTPSEQHRIFGAAHLGKCRLIDNIKLIENNG